MTLKALNIEEKINKLDYIKVNWGPNVASHKKLGEENQVQKIKIFLLIK